MPAKNSSNRQLNRRPNLKRKYRISNVKKRVDPVRSAANRRPTPPKDDRNGRRRGHRHDPVQFARAIVHTDLWDKQAEILRALSAHNQVAVRSCNGAGKTYIAAVAVLWWLMSYDDAIVITTAPTERQVREVLWRQLRTLYLPRKDEIGGRFTRTRLDFTPKRYAYGFSTNTEDRFQGFHSGNVLVIVDEASGVDEYIYNAIEGVASSDNSKLLLIGNPHGFAGTFYNAFNKNREQFHTVQISAFDLPSFKHYGATPENIENFDFDAVEPPPDLPHNRTLSSPRWAQRIYKTHGPQSSVYQTRVLGQFPEEADDTLIPLAHVEAAIQRQVETGEHPHVIGVDVARFGSDKTVIVVRKGPKVVYVEELRKSDIVNTTGRVIHAIQRYDAQEIVIDEIGVGAGVVDSLRNDTRYNVRGVNVGKNPRNAERYLNLRAEMFDGLRQRFADNDISIPDDPELVSQLASLTYKYNSRGQLQIQGKDAVRKLGGQSPDKADALAISFTATQEPSPFNDGLSPFQRMALRFQTFQRQNPQFQEDHPLDYT